MLATGAVPVKYAILPGGFQGTDDTVAIMAKVSMGRYGARSPKIRALAKNIIAAAHVPEKDYQGEAYALAKWVRDKIRYMKDPYGQETISHPEEIAFNMHAGDCDDQAVLLAALLGSVGVPTRFKVIGQSPQMYSHVYLQACPKGRWITFDPIMSDKPVGWEVPKHQRAIEKAYPVNGPDGWLPQTGVNGMDGLGYVGDPRVVSHLEIPTIPYGAGKGDRPRRSAGHPAYVSMPSLLDTDEPVDHLIHFHPNQNSGRRIGPGVARRVDPQLKRHAGPPGGRIPSADLHPAEAEALQGRHEVFGPDAIAGMDLLGVINGQSVPAHMTALTVAQAPEGVDSAFTREALVLDPNRGDKVLYDAYWNDPMVKPVPRPVTNLAGDPASNPRDMLPGMGYLGDMAGPGMGADATGTETTGPLPAGAPPVGMSRGAKTLLGLAIAGVAYHCWKNRG